MPRTTKKFVEDFLIPNLNKETFGDLLEWEDRPTKCFRIKWNHKAARNWTVRDTAVFEAWDIMKGHYKPGRHGYQMDSKQRFRAALEKLESIKRLPSIEANIKRYYFVNIPGRRKRNLSEQEYHESVPSSPENFYPSPEVFVDEELDLPQNADTNTTGSNLIPEREDSFDINSFLNASVANFNLGVSASSQESYSNTYSPNTALEGLPNEDFLNAINDDDIPFEDDEFYRDYLRAETTLLEFQ